MSADASSSTRPKRQLVKAACQSCQKRKVKCSGERPSCMLCQQRSQTCVYDSEAGITRVEAVRRRNKELAEQNSNYELVYNALQTAPEPEAFDHLRRLRECPNVESYARTLRESKPFSRKRPHDGNDPLMDDCALSNLSPTSNSAHSQDSHDDELHAFHEHAFSEPPSTANSNDPPQSLPTMMIDPRLGQQTLYNFPGSNGSTLQSLAETWPFQNSAYVQQDVFQPSNHQSWGEPGSQIQAQVQAQATAASSQNTYLYDVQMSQTGWTDLNDQIQSRRESRFAR